MKHFEKIEDLPTLDLYKEFRLMLDKKIISWNGYKQICINSIPGHENDTSLGAGSLYYDWEKANRSADGSLSAPKKEQSLKESDFTELCSQFKGTMFEEVYNALKSKYTLGRVRVMESTPKTCLTWHVDPSHRIHYPLKTQEGCFMVIEDEVFHIPENEWYFTNTKMRHTAFNGSKESRLHLVAAVLTN